MLATSCLAANELFGGGLGRGSLFVEALRSVSANLRAPCQPLQPQTLLTAPTDTFV